MYEYSTRYMSMEFDRCIPKGGMDFFEVQRHMEKAKREIIRYYPYMTLFVQRAFRETDEELLAQLAENMDGYTALISSVYSRAGVSRFKEGVDPSAILKLCLFTSDGILNDQFLSGKLDPEAFLEEILKYLALLEKHLCRSEEFYF